MEWWGWVAAGIGAIVLVSNGISAVKNIFAPLLKLDSRVKEIEKHDERDVNRFDLYDMKFKQQEETNQATLQALLALINHNIDGNGIDGMKKARDELMKYIINR